MKAPVLAFLQNMWFPEGTPDSIVGRYLTDQSYRRRVLANCMTGRRLKKAFREYYHEIWWENASKLRAEEPAGRFPADVEHMRQVFLEVQPKAVIAFGNIARDGIMVHPGKPEPIPEPWHYFPHPNARGLKQVQLDEFATKIIGLYF